MKKNYADTIQFLFSSRQHALDYKLDRCYKIYEALGSPQKTYPTIHIAGTNGKGSTAYKIAKSLEASGYRTGLYTSPHISSYRERIQIDSCMIPEETVTDLVWEVKELSNELDVPLSFFEITTIVAFLYFARSSVDAAVIEAGLGGRLDATNALSPILTVITSISLDHTHILGDTIEKIAQEKAGILHPNVPAVIGPSVPISCIPSEVPIDRVSNSSPSAIASAAIERLAEKFDIPADIKAKSLNLSPPCRFEIIQKRRNACIILDVAHNPSAIRHLFDEVGKKFPNKTHNAIMALTKSKDVEKCLEAVPSNCQITVTQSAHERCIPAQELYKQAIAKRKSVFLTFSVAEAIERTAKELTIVFGSFFIMRDARRALGMADAEDPIQTYEEPHQIPGVYKKR